MTFNAGTLVATIQLQGKSKFDSDLDSSGRKFAQTSTLAQKAGHLIGETFKGASIATGVLTAATVGYVGSLLKTGVAYNQLQSTSRAALATMLGGAKAANAQMDKLDVFARTSPFAKQVFITAQQQLIGFGLSAQKVIPALKAIQDSVAAVGGNGEDVAQVTSALAEMEGQGKLSGETLQQLGQFGINAADLLGKKMGKTGAEIRAMASKPGGIPVDQVWDPLVSALEDRFAGAADNVENTFAGTVDSIKAASRDLGSALAEPFVGHEGGGLAITWGNDVADVLRAVQTKIGPIVTILTGKAEPAFRSITTWLGKAKDEINGWDPSKIGKTLDKIGSYAPAIAGVGGAVTAMNLGFLKSIPIVGDLVPKINPLAAAIAGVALSSPEARDALGDVLDAAKPLVPVVGDLAKVLAQDLDGVLPTAAGLLGAVADVAKPLLGLIQDIPTPVLLAVGAFAAFKKVQQPLADGLLNSGIKVEGFLSHLGPVGGKLGGLVDAFGNAAAFMTGPWGLAVGGAGAILAGLFFDDVAKAQQKIQDYTGTLDENTGALTRNTRQVAFKHLYDSGAIQAGKSVGVSSKTTVDAALGDTKATQMVDSQYKAAYAAAQNPPKGTTSEQYQELLKQAKAWSLLHDAIGTENDALQANIDKNDAWLQASAAAQTAQDAVKASVKDFNDAVATNTVNVDTSSAAYKANKSALDDLGAKANDYITTTQNQYDSTQKTAQAQTAMSQTLVAAAVQMGMSQGAAIKYTAQLLGIPESRVTETAVTGVGPAAANAKSVKDAVNAIPSNKTARVTVDAYGAFATLNELNAYLNQLGNKEVAIGGGAAGYYGFRQANGGYWEHNVQAFANGGMPSGIYPGRRGGIIKFAESETNWETFISGKTDQRARNQKLLEMTAQRLGMMVVPVGAARPQAFANGGTTIPRSASASPSEQPRRGDTIIKVYPSPGMNEEDLARKVARIVKGL